jgi:benzil reductase ((S)-benzoin forming)
LEILLITGTGSGFGYQLADVALRNGLWVMSVGRSHHPGSQYRLFQELDSAFNTGQMLEQLDIINPKSLRVIFNSFAFAGLKKAQQVSPDSLLTSLRLNISNNKLLLDALLSRQQLPKAVVDVSSGASKQGYEEWLLYCVPKAAMVSMLQVYAVEFPIVRFLSVSPGVMQTRLNHELLQNASGNYEWSEKLCQNSRATSVVAPIFLRDYVLNESLPSGFYKIS